MDDEPLMRGRVELADTHPSMFPLMWPLTYLGEVPHVPAIILICAFFATGNYVGLYYAPVWFVVWWCYAKLTAHDYHLPATLMSYVGTGLRDLTKGKWGGECVTPNPRRDAQPLGIYAPVEAPHDGV